MACDRQSIRTPQQLGVRITYMQQIDLFAPIRELLSSPEKWTKGAYARDALGHHVSVFADEAAQRCLIGAVCAAHNPLQGTVNELCTTELQRRLQLEPLSDDDVASVAGYNDLPTTTFEDIQRLLAEPFYGPSDAAP
jgi:hypothetical protein